MGYFTGRPRMRWWERVKIKMTDNPLEHLRRSGESMVILTDFCPHITLCDYQNTEFIILFHGYGQLEHLHNSQRINNTSRRENE